jgi:pyruvate dehydrogenase E2 component (dihydrolipoamide acetyltransferase)
MAQIIGLPKLSPTMEEGVLLRWVKKEGDKVSPGDLVAEVETDKANMDFNMEDDGVILKLLVKEGETVKLGAPVAILGKAGEDVSALIAQAASGAPATKAAAVPASVPASVSVSAPASVSAPVSAPASGGGLLASPLAKTLAIELGVDLRTIAGTGPGGRIVERDVKAAASGATPARAAAPAPASAPAASTETGLAVRSKPAAPSALGAVLDPSEFHDEPASNMRRRIAARLTEAKRDVPHFYLQRKFDAAPLLAFRTRLNELLGDRGKISVNDLIIKAVAVALRRVPECNAAWVTGDDGHEAIRRFHRVHVGVAVAIEDGLVTPVVRDADLKGLGAIGAEVRDLAERAKHRQLKGHEITGSTFTVSNLGMFGIERFTAIINPPEAGILAIGAVVDEPVIKDGAVVPGKRLTVSMSCDHRVIDGALGARWLVALGELIEKPESLAL